MVTVLQWPKTLYELITNGDKSIISWTENGDGFIIHSVNEFQKPDGILFKYFPGVKDYNSFARSCSNYFMKTKSFTSPIIRKHKYGIFHRDHPERLNLVFNKESLLKEANMILHQKTLTDIGYVDPPPVPVQEKINILANISSKLTSTNNKLDDLKNDLILIKDDIKNKLKYEKKISRRKFINMIYNVCLQKVDDPEIEKFKTVIKKYIDENLK
jgi:hypothetical protein